MGIRHVDLLQLYRRVTEEGGYDLCSDTKAKPLMWRKLAEEFIGKNQYTAAQAFQIKSVYYRYLCAYEIRHHFDQEPPPKEILEDMTAKGGGVMGRTLENFQPPTSREDRNLQGDDSEPEQSTPKDKDEQQSQDDPGSATGRSTRGLRQQPPQRVLFQPDLSASRQTRGHMQQGTSGSPQPAQGQTTANSMMHATAMSNGATSTLANYEPQQSYPLSLKPVITPANNPDFYRNERKRKLEATAGPLARKYRNIMLPGTGFIGPNIYVRAQLALQSGIPEEEQYALHHLVKISHERGDKYRFDQFPGLAEALVKKALHVSGLFYDVDWDISYDDDETYLQDGESLNGLRGTSDVIQKLKSRIPRINDDRVHDAAFQSELNRVTEAGLVIRNMCMLEENASYLSRLPLIRDYLSIVLDLPQHPSIVELQHYALETAEQVLKYCDIGSQDAMYHSLISVLERQDRGAVILALKSLSRIAMHLPPPKRLDYIPDEVLQRVQSWLLVEDEELRCACLDFFMQYTSFADNVDNLLQSIDAEALARQLSRLLFFAAKEHRDLRPKTRQEKPAEAMVAHPVPRLSRGIVETLLRLEEPNRSSEWLRMCFASDPASEMTQISLWQAYQQTFAAFHVTHPHLIAGDFIKNVSNTFSGATAQVAEASKYVIRGIKARQAPAESGKPGARELHKCCWNIDVPTPGTRDPRTGVYNPPTTQESECPEWFITGDDIFKHILNVHLQIPFRRIKSEIDGDRMDIDSHPSRPSSALANGLSNGTTPKSLDAAFDFRGADASLQRCRWANCHRSVADFANPKTNSAALLARHIQTHLPDPSATKSRHNIKASSPPTEPDKINIYYTTLSDERNDAAGVALGAALVLRNIAKFMPRDEAPSIPIGTIGDAKGVGDDDDKESLMNIVFDEEVRERLCFAISNNRTIKDYVGSVLRAVKAAA